LASFLGSLPPGTTNILTIQLTAIEGAFTALLFSLGCMVAEMVYVFVCLALMDRLLRFANVLSSLQWISLAVLILLSIASFVSASSNQIITAISASTGKSPFLFGFLLMIINPVQAPFWLGWTTLLVEKKMLRPQVSHYALYIFGVCFGSFIANVLFIACGRYVFEKSGVTMEMFHYATGIFFLISATIQAATIFKGFGARQSIFTQAGRNS